MFEVTGTKIKVTGAVKVISVYTQYLKKGVFILHRMIELYEKMTTTVIGGHWVKVKVTGIVNVKSFSAWYLKNPVTFKHFIQNL